jgi:uncharacterized protein
MLRSSRNAVVAFFVLTFGLSWLAWGTLLANEAGLLGWRLPENAGFLAVPVAAVVVAAWFDGRRALGDFFRRFLIWRLPLRWYLAALILPGLPALAAIGFFVAAGGRPEVGGLVPVAATVPLLLTQFVTHLLTEEAGWRGFALPRLRALRGPLASSLILGAVWAVWHVPLFFAPDTKQTYPFAGFAIQVIAITIVMTWIFDNTRGSILIAALFHAAMNTWWAVLNVLWGASALFWLCVGFTVVLAAIVLVLQRRNPGQGTGRLVAPEQVGDRAGESLFSTVPQR